MVLNVRPLELLQIYIVHVKHFQYFFSITLSSQSQHFLDLFMKISIMSILLGSRSSISNSKFSNDLILFISYISLFKINISSTHRSVWDESAQTLGLTGPE